MKIIQLSVGRPKHVEFEGRRVETSIFKIPVDGRVPVGLLNIAGDEQSDLSVHGGRDKAIYAYSYDYYSDWAQLLGKGELEDAQFGENITVAGCRDTEVLIGARYRIGELEAIVAQPRIPCFKLGIRMNDKSFPKLFWETGRLGFYLRIEKEGSISRDDEIRLLHRPEHGITVRKLFETINDGRPEDALNAIDHLPHLDSGWIRRLRHVAGNRHNV